MTYIIKILSCAHCIQGPLKETDVVSIVTVR